MKNLSFALLTGLLTLSFFALPSYADSDTNKNGTVERVRNVMVEQKIIGFTPDQDNQREEETFKYFATQLTIHLDNDEIISLTQPQIDYPYNLGDRVKVIHSNYATEIRKL